MKRLYPEERQYGVQDKETINEWKWIRNAFIDARKKETVVGVDLCKQAVKYFGDRMRKNLEIDNVLSFSVISHGVDEKETLVISTYPIVSDGTFYQYGVDSSNNAQYLVIPEEGDEDEDGITHDKLAKGLMDKLSYVDHTEEATEEEIK